MLMVDWFNWFVALGSTAIDWLATMEIFGVPVIVFIISIFVMGVLLDAILYKA